MLNENQKSRVLDELAFIMFTGNLRPVENEDQPEETDLEDDDDMEDEEALEDQSPEAV